MYFRTWFSFSRSDTLLLLFTWDEFIFRRFWQDTFEVDVCFYLL